MAIYPNTIDWRFYWQFHAGKGEDPKVGTVQLKISLEQKERERRSKGNGKQGNCKWGYVGVFFSEGGVGPPLREEANLGFH